MTDLTVIVLSYNTKDLTLQCLRSIYKYKWSSSLKVILIDNASADNTKDEVKKNFPEVDCIVNKQNLGFSAGNNIGLRQVDSKYSLLLNSDTELTPNCLDILINFMDKKNIDIGSCKLLNSNGSFQPNAGELPTLIPVLSWLTGLDDLLNSLFQLPSFHAKSKKYFSGEKEVGWVSGAAMMINSQILSKVGFLDESIFMYDEDVDFCMRVKKSKGKIGWTDKTTIIHTGGASLDKPQLRQWSLEFKNLIYLYQKNYGIFTALFLRFLIILSVIARIIGFTLVGKLKYSKTYVQVLFNI